MSKGGKGGLISDQKEKGLRGRFEIQRKRKTAWGKARRRRGTKECDPHSISERDLGLPAERGCSWGGDHQNSRFQL